MHSRHELLHLRRSALLKLNIGFNRKTGEANYGSRGASVNLELELDRGLVTNALTEGFNSRIQSLKSTARGFRRFANYRTRILFYCGKLQLLPDGTSH